MVQISDVLIVREMCQKWSIVSSSIYLSVSIILWRINEILVRMYTSAYGDLPQMLTQVP